MPIVLCEQNFKNVPIYIYITTCVKYLGNGIIFRFYYNDEKI